ncbi:MAG: DEAD/DEAH box helicase [Gammaproteobacteria bacterium]|nr:DEAD/DEAH box helicase [Gammaproteobacteria bacterium]
MNDELEANKADEEEELLAFTELALPRSVQKGIDRLEFKTCTKVQSQVLPYSLSQYDVCAEANTGTGKTAAFLTTILAQQIEYPLETPNANGAPRALVLAPTRELTMQIKQDMNALSKFTKVRSLAVVGGKRVKDQRDKLRHNRIDVIIATPGRLLDFMQQGLVDLSRVEILVIDEADRMLDMGFIPDVRRIVRRTPHRRDRQTMFFSATFNDDVRRLIKQWMFEPVQFDVPDESIAADSIEQHFWIVEHRKKNRVLHEFMKRCNPERTLIFVNRRSHVKQVVKALKDRGVQCEGLSGDMQQRKRTAALNRFKRGETRHVVATDVAGRGLHVEGISHVVNYDLPDIVEDYVHRIGRTGRAGAIGKSISFVSEADGFVVPDLEELLGQSIDCMLPNYEMVQS